MAVHLLALRRRRPPASWTPRWPVARSRATPSRTCKTRLTLLLSAIPSTATLPTTVCRDSRVTSSTRPTSSATAPAARPTPAAPRYNAFLLTCYTGFMKALLLVVSLSLLLPPATQTSPLPDTQRLLTLFESRYAEAPPLETKFIERYTE